MTVSIGNLSGGGVSLDTTIGANRGRTIQVDEDTTYAEITKRFNRFELQWFRELNNLDGVDLNQSAKGKTLKIPSQSLFGEAADGGISHLTKNAETKPATDPRSLMGERPDGRSGFEAATADPVNLTGRTEADNFGHFARIQEQLAAHGKTAAKLERSQIQVERQLQAVKEFKGIRHPNGDDRRKLIRALGKDPANEQVDVLTSPTSVESITDSLLRSQAELTQRMSDLSARHADFIKESKRLQIAAANPKGLRMGNAERVIADEIVSSSGPGDMALGPEGRAIVYAKVAEISEDFKAQGNDPEKMPVKDFRSLVLLELSEAAAISHGNLTPDLTAKMKHLYENNKRAFDANPHRREALVLNYALSCSATNTQGTLRGESDAFAMIRKTVPKDLQKEVVAVWGERRAELLNQTSANQTSTVSTQSGATASTDARISTEGYSQAHRQAQYIFDQWQQLSSQYPQVPGSKPPPSVEQLTERILDGTVVPEEWYRILQSVRQGRDGRV